MRYREASPVVCRTQVGKHLTFLFDGTKDKESQTGVKKCRTLNPDL